MSTIIMSACWPLQGMSPAQKSVLISLSDNANDEGVCWPSVTRISERTCLSERAVQGAIKWLCQVGIMDVRTRNGRSTVYTITPASYAPPQNMHPALDAPSPPQETTQTPAASAPRTVIEPSVEPSPPAGTGEASSTAKSKCPPQAIVDLFNEVLPEMPSVVLLTDDRIKKIKARWNDSAVHQDLDFWRDFFGLVRMSPFLMGAAKGGTGQSFRCNFDWLICPSNFVKVVEGNYRA